MKIFHTNKWTGTDIETIGEVIRRGDLGFGPNVTVFEEKYSLFSKKKFNTSTNSASAAAFMIFHYLLENYGQCDVYTTSLGFTSPAWAAKHFGHNLIFVDVQDDLQFSSEHYRQIRKESGNKIVVMPVLYGGVSTIKNFNLVGDEIVVIDSAHCATPTIKSDFVFFSFHTYKPICTSDGGMISTDIEEADAYFKSYRNFGRKADGQTYNIIQHGFKFYMNNLNATIGLTQLEHYPRLLQERRSNYDKLKEKYNLLEHDENSSYYFATTLSDDADSIIEDLKISRHYPMLHKTNFYHNGQRLPKLESLHSKILNLPLYMIEFSSKH